MKNLPIGELLKKYGFINDQHIQVALKIKKVLPNKLIGEILRDLSFISTSDIAFALAKQSGKEYIEVNDIIPEKEALNLIPKDVAYQFRILPFKVDEKNVYICVADPYNLVAIDLIKKRSGKNVVVYVGDENLILKVIQIYYSLLEYPLDKQFEDLLKRATNEGIANVSSILVEFIINSGIINRASDIHITPENSTTNVFYRIDGVMYHFYALPYSFHPYIVSRIKILSNLDIAEQRLPQDGSFSHTFSNENYDLRVSTVPTSFGENLVMRILSKNVSIFNLETLGFEDFQIKEINEQLNKSFGMILLTGPTGSGKTTTLYSALRKINVLNRNVITVEDPIEYKFPFIKQTQVNDRAGYTFSSAIRAFLRQDPDVILIGEMRDLETIETAIRASMTGHLVLSTLHTNDAISTIPRLLDMGVKPFLISSSLNVIISQRLIRKVCHGCKQKLEVDINYLANVLNIDLDTIKNYVNDNKVQIVKGIGCSSCNGTGYLGRSVVAEVFTVDEKIAEAINENKGLITIKNLAKKKGIKTIKEVGLLKVLKNETTPEEINRVLG